MRKTYYEKLGLKEHATYKEIKETYRKQALIYHLYKSSGNHAFEKTFNRNTTIYQTLSSPACRKAYDARLRKRRAEPKESENSNLNYFSTKSSYTPNKKDQKVKKKSNFYNSMMTILILFLLKLMFNLLAPPVQSSNVGSNYTFTTGIPVFK